MALPAANRLVGIQIGRFTVFVPDNSMMPNSGEAMFDIAGNIRERMTRLGRHANQQTLQRIANDEFLRIYGNNYLQAFHAALLQQNPVPPPAPQQQQQQANDDDDDETVVDEDEDENEEEEEEEEEEPIIQWFNVRDLPVGDRHYWQHRYNLGLGDRIELAADHLGIPLHPNLQPSGTIRVLRRMRNSTPPAQRQPLRRQREVIDVDADDQRTPARPREVINVDEDDERTPVRRRSYIDVDEEEEEEEAPAGGYYLIEWKNVPPKWQRRAQQVAERGGPILYVKLFVLSNGNFAPQQNISADDVIQE